MMIDVIGTDDKGVHVNLAASYGLVDLLEKFRLISPACLNQGNPYSEKGSSPLSGAAWAHILAVDYLLKQGVDPIGQNLKGWPAIYGAIARGELDIFKRILQSGLDVP